MSVSINLPEDLYEQAVVIAKSRKVPVDEIIASAFAEQIAIWRLKELGAHADRQKFLAVLDKAPDVEPAEHDRV
jgi:hypothetical protein